MSKGGKQQLIAALTFLGGLYFFLEFITPESVLTYWGVAAKHAFISDGFAIVAVMAVGLGVISILIGHGSRLIFRRKGWFDSAALLSGLIAMMTITVLNWRQDVAVTRAAKETSILGDFALRIDSDSKESVATSMTKEQRVNLLNERLTSQVAKIDEQVLVLPSDKQKLLKPEVESLVQAVNSVRSGSGDLTELGKNIRALGVTHAKILRAGNEGSLPTRLYKLLYDGLFVSLGSAMFSLLGVYIAAAAYRAFRIRSVESSLMMAAAVLVILGQIPFITWHIWGISMTEIRQWLLEVPNSAAFRAIRIGASVAGLMMAIRMWLSIESDSFAGQQ